MKKTWLTEPVITGIKATYKKILLLNAYPGKKACRNDYCCSKHGHPFYRLHATKIELKLIWLLNKNGHQTMTIFTWKQ